MHTILIIDDEETLRSTLADRLTLEGFRVQTAASGEDGLRQAQAEPPDLILCDIMMPGLDGPGVLQALQVDPLTAAIPFIFLTAKADPPHVRVGMDLGADDYLCKPVGKAELLMAIRARLWKRYQQQERLDQEVTAAHQDVVGRLPHELLTPLTSLLSASQLLESADPTQPVAEVQQLGQEIRKSAERLHRLIRRFLLYSQLGVASRHPKAQAQLRGTGYIPASAWLSAYAEFLARQDARADDLQLDLREAEVIMDPIHFSELVVQLVDNAFKFSLPGSVVQIQLVLPPGGGCVLTVRDQGRGMTPDQLRQVRAFRQFDSDVWAQAGTGLGLALVKQIAALYGGTFALESQPGNGTRATVRLPDARPRTQSGGALDAELRQRVAWTLGIH
jgi:signal transduction histidine kinase